MVTPSCWSSLIIFFSLYFIVIKIPIFLVPLQIIEVTIECVKYANSITVVLSVSLYFSIERYD